jgi:type I site-specific restriction-modification system R (restriction) subunit
MTSFVETLTPAAKEHAVARIDYYNDLSQAVLNSMQRLASVNAQFSRDWLDNSTSALRDGLASPVAERAAQLAPTAQATLAALRDYHQQLSKLATEFQAEITEVVQQHAPQATRTAANLVDAGQRAAEDTRRAAEQKISEDASRFANVAAQNQSMPQAASMQSDEGGNKT